LSRRITPADVPGAIGVFVTARDDNRYHGIIVNLSQRDRTILRSLSVIGRRRLLFGLITLYKVAVGDGQLSEVIGRLQANMADRVLFKKMNFYAHFYRGNELIIVYRDRVFPVTIEKSTWTEAIAHGMSLGIPAGQLDFYPCSVADEYY
jgi:hypothetical protein